MRRRRLLHVTMDGRTPEAPTLRPATPADLDAVAALLRAQGLPLDGVPASLAGFVVAHADGALAGVAGVEPCGAYGLLRSVAVAPAWRGRGLGAALVRAAIADAEGRGTAALYLLTTTAERWFPRFGFRPVAREGVPDAVRATAEFREACPASAAVMCRDGAALAPLPS